MMSTRIRSVHPFPARMVPSIVMDELPEVGEREVRVLDPMSGSGTTLVAARERGFTALGVDSDPLAVLIARVWCGDVAHIDVLSAAERVLDDALTGARTLQPSGAFPPDTDQETRDYISFWFDDRSRVEIASLAQGISAEKSVLIRNILWCSLSRMIITKSKGVSLAMDVSHSRPHKVYLEAPLSALSGFLVSVRKVLRTAPFGRGCGKPKARIVRADARSLPHENESIDFVITSPPYLNAIDYMRGHRMSLVWMGYLVRDLREIRSNNVGTLAGFRGTQISELENITGAVSDARNLRPSHKGMLSRYITDMDRVCEEITRVLKRGGQATFVVADSKLEGVAVQNSLAISLIAKKHKLKHVRSRTREIDARHRYLPAPKHLLSGAALQARMREESIMTFAKE